MRKIIERVLLFVVAPLALLLATAEMWRASLEEQYLERIDALRRAGEPTTLEEIVDPERVAAYESLREVADRYEAHKDTWEVDPFEALGGVQDEWTDEDWELIARLHEGCARIVDAAEHASLEGPFQMRIEMTATGLATSDLHRINYIRELLTYWMGIHTRRGEGTPEVVRAAGSMMRIAEHVEPQLPIEWMFVESMREAAHVHLREAARREGFDLESAMRALGPLLEVEPEQARLTEVFVGERTAGIWAFDQLLEGKGARALLEMFGPPASRTGRDVIDSLMELRPAQGFAYKATISYLDFMDEAVPLARRRPLEAMPALARIATRDPGSGQFAFVAEAYRRLLPRFYSHWLRALTHQRICRIELALRLFHRRHGRWPESLEELPAPVPLNPYREEPFRYENGVLWAEQPDEEFFRWTWSPEFETDPLRVELTDQR